jgi:hypothetical protein
MLSDADSADDDISVQAASHLIHYYTSGQQAFLDFAHFQHLVLTCEKPKLRAKSTQREIHAPLTSELCELVTLLMQELCLWANAELFKQQLRRRYDFDALALFRLVDDCYLGFINY